MGQVGRYRRRRWPFVILAILVILVAALVGVDIAVRTATQDAIATDVQRSTHADGASASISSFLFLYDAVAEGRVDRVSITARGVPVGLIRLDQVRLVASQVHFARRQLLSNHKVELTQVGSATLTITTHLSSLEGTIAQDLGVRVTSPSSGRIALSAGGVTVATIDLTQAPIVPDCPLLITNAGDNYTFSCTVSPVPASVLAALSKA